MKIVYLLRNPGIENSTPHGWSSTVMSADPQGHYSDADLEQVQDADFLVVGLEPVGEELLDRAPRLKLIQRLGVGFCNVDLDAASRRDIPVCYMPDFNAGTVAEHTLMLILALLRRVFESTLLMKAGHWPVLQVANDGIYDLQGKRLGLLGFGAIGQAVAARARPFGPEIWYHDRQERPEAEDLGASPVDLARLVKNCDILSIHVPLTSETRNLIGREQLRSMRSTALLVNTARGAVVDEDALAEALGERWIAGAALDVFSSEPLDPRHPLRKCPNLLLTPHLAGQTREAMQRMVDMMLENLKRVAEGKQPLYRVPMES